LLFATVAVTASDQFLSFDYIGPMSGTLGEASRLTFRVQTLGLNSPNSFGKRQLPNRR
jgi:hypothetical protein